MLKFRWLVSLAYASNATQHPGSTRYPQKSHSTRRHPGVRRHPHLQRHEYLFFAICRCRCPCDPTSRSNPGKLYVFHGPRKAVGYVDAHAPKCFTMCDNAMCTTEDRTPLLSPRVANSLNVAVAASATVAAAASSTWSSPDGHRPCGPHRFGRRLRD